MSEPESRPSLVLVTGLSGSGKSSVAKCFEDLGYYVVDNMPLPLLRAFLDDPVTLVEGREQIAVVTDVRAPRFAEELPALLAEVDRKDLDLTLLFLEASDEALVRRFSETRRPHPLAGQGTAIDGIQRERRMLSDLRRSSDMVIDTSEYSIHQVRSHIYREFAPEAEDEPTMAVSLVSFGFKFGIPYGTDLLFDVRCLPNPHFVPSLKEHTGLEEPIREFLAEQPEVGELEVRLADLLTFLLPLYKRENRSYLSIAIGCTGGRHRSVAMAEALKSRLEAAGWPARTVHRDIGR